MQLSSYLNRDITTTTTNKDTYITNAIYSSNPFNSPVIYRPRHQRAVRGSRLGHCHLSTREYMHAVIDFALRSVARTWLHRAHLLATIMCPSAINSAIHLTHENFVAFSVRPPCRKIQIQCEAITNTVQDGSLSFTFRPHLFTTTI